MKIQLMGYFDRNFGDDVMQLILADGMPEHDFYVSCAQKEFLGHFSGHENVHSAEKLPEIDAVVNVIGTGFLYRSRLAMVSKALSLLREKGFSSSRTAVLDCSADMPKMALERFFMGHDLKQYGLISCRDQRSYQIMSELSKKSIVACHEDLVFAVDQKLLSPKTGEGCLGIVPVYRLYSERNYDYCVQLAKACDTYAEEQQKKVLIFALDTGTENDLLSAMTIRRLMKHADAAEIVPYDSKPEKIFSQMARCSKIISSRFHGVIAAILAGVPVSAVSDTSKLDILSEKLGFERLPMEGTCAEQLTALINRTNQSVELPESVRKDAGAHLTELRSYLERG